MKEPQVTLKSEKAGQDDLIRTQPERQRATTNGQGGFGAQLAKVAGPASRGRFRGQQLSLVVLLPWQSSERVQLRVATVMGHQIWSYGWNLSLAVHCVLSRPFTRGLQGDPWNASLFSVCYQSCHQAPPPRRKELPRLWLGSPQRSKSQSHGAV